MLSIKVYEWDWLCANVLVLLSLILSLPQEMKKTHFLSIFKSKLKVLFRRPCLVLNFEFITCASNIFLVETATTSSGDTCQELLNNLEL